MRRCRKRLRTPGEITKLSKFTKKITKDDSLVIFLVSFVTFENFPVRCRD